MKISHLLLFAMICISFQLKAQSKPELSVKIDQLAKNVMPYIHTEDVFMKTGKSLIGTADYKEIKKIVISHGFPTVSMVGKESSHKFWMMIQLCDFDHQMQMAVLKQMGTLLRKGDIIKEDYAMLTDRSRMNRNLPQLYGTQYVLDQDGEVMIYQIHDIENVNDRRKMLNLSKLEDAKKPEVNMTTSKSAADNTYDDRPRAN